VSKRGEGECVIAGCQEYVRDTRSKSKFGADFASRPTLAVRWKWEPSALLRLQGARYVNSDGAPRSRLSFLIHILSLAVLYQHFFFFFFFLNDEAVIWAAKTGQRINKNKNGKATSTTWAVYTSGVLMCRAAGLQSPTMFRHGRYPVRHVYSLRFFSSMREGVSR
jgi:hypothetical protein